MNYRFVLMLLLIGFAAPGGFAMQDQYKEGQAYGSGGVALGDPTKVDDGFLERNKNTAHLQNMNDTTLSEQGSDAYKSQSAEEESQMRSKSAKQASDNMAASGQKAQSTHSALQTENGNLLTHSEIARIDATQEHKIDPKDQLYKASFAIEESPLNKTGGIAIKTNNKITKTTNHTCEEGVKFQVDVVNQLTYVPPPLVTYQVQVKHAGQLASPTLRTGLIHVPEAGRITSAWVRLDNYGDPNIYLCKCTYRGFIAGVGMSTTWPNCGHGAGGLAPFTVNNISIPVSAGQSIKFQLNGGQAWGVARYRGWSINMNVTKHKRDNKPAQEHWRIINKDSESLIEQHSCHQIKRQCLDSGTKHFDELVVTRPCWKEQITYACESQPIDGCHYYQDQGCTLQKSICINKTVNPCAKWQRHYQCTTYEEQHTPGIGETDLFCLGGDCHQPKLEQDKDMQQAVAQLSIFKEMQKNMSSTNPPTVFRGEVGACSIKMIGFNDCCADMSGWGSSMGLANCGEDEKALAQKKAKKLCHYVGTFCAEKIPLTGVCVRKKSTYCCFANKLARVFHEQGRPQLGRTWGSAENPECGAFTAHELQKIKFEKMDLSEIFQDVFKGVGAKALKAVPKQMQNQMPTTQKNIEIMREEAMKTGGSSVTKQVF